MLLAFRVTKASKEKRENEEKVGISSRELKPQAPAWKTRALLIQPSGLSKKDGYTFIEYLSR